MRTHVPRTMSEAPCLQGLSGLEKEQGGDSKGPPRSSGSLTEDTDQAQSWEARPQSRPQAKAARPLPADPAPSRLPGSGLSGDTAVAPPGSLFQAPQTGEPGYPPRLTFSTIRPPSRPRPRSSRATPGSSGPATVPRVRRLWHGGLPRPRSPPPPPHPAAGWTLPTLRAAAPPAPSPPAPRRLRSPAAPSPPAALLP